MLNRSLPAYQMSMVSGSASLLGTTKRTVSVPPALNVPLACLSLLPSFPADFTMARPCVARKLSMPRSSRLVPSWGPRLSPWLRLMTAGLFKAAALLKM